MPSATLNPEYLLPRDAARLMGCQSAWVRYLIDTGRLPAHRTPGGVRILRRADVEAFLRKRDKSRDRAAR